MKKILVITLITIGLFGCSTSPYRKKADLPGNIKYYSVEKQFKITPDWYWRVRPSTQVYDTIGFRYLKQKDSAYHNQNVNVIGETMKNDNKYLVVNWEPHGYYFIKKTDYLFAEKNKKYLVPLPYDDKSLYRDPFKVISGGPFYYLDSKINPKEKLHYHLNITRKMKKFYTSKGYTFFSVMGNRAIATIRKEEFSTHLQKQIIENRIYSNKFLIIPHSQEFHKFCLNPDIQIGLIEFPSMYLDNKQYTNTYGAVYNGQVFMAQYIVGRWGDVFYAFPCN